MDRTDLVRLRWRMSGAWFWPSFIVLSLIDAAVIHGLPPTGDSIPTVGAWLVGATAMLLAMALFSPALGMVLRRGRRDLPKPIARNYAATFVVCGVSIAFFVAGLIHHSVVANDRIALRDAEARAEAWIGDHAPSEFRSDARDMTWLEVQPPQIYRICVPNSAGSRYYCVVVNRRRPFPGGVRPDGTESNQLLGQGTS